MYVLVGMIILIARWDYDGTLYFGVVTSLLVVFIVILCRANYKMTVRVISNG
jgi:hypothetical protein